MTGPADPASPGQLREQLVRRLRADGTLRDERVAGAMLAVPRHAFLPGIGPERAYTDDAIVTKSDAAGLAISSSSQPAIMALMLEQLDVRPGHRVLEIGAGTGYNAALLAELAGPAGRVSTVDLDEDTAAAARAHLDACGFAAAGVHAADGWAGWPAGAPYDRIILTVGAWDIAPAWTAQLAPAGRLVLPLSLGPGMQYSIAFDRAGDQLESASIIPCGFMRLRGPSAGPESLHPLGGPGGVIAEVSPRPDGADPVEVLLDQPGQDVPAGMSVTPRALWAGLGLWLAARETGVGRLSAFRPPDGPPRPESLSFVPPGGPGVMILTSAHGCAALVPLEAGGHGDRTQAFPLAVRPFGPDGGRLAARLAELARSWDAAGRPGPGDLTISASPFGKKITTGDDEAVIEKEHTTLHLRWRRVS